MLSKAALVSACTGGTTIRTLYSHCFTFFSSSTTTTTHNAIKSGGTDDTLQLHACNIPGHSTKVLEMAKRLISVALSQHDRRPEGTANTSSIEEEFVDSEDEDYSQIDEDDGEAGRSTWKIHMLSINGREWLVPGQSSLENDNDGGVKKKTSKALHLLRHGDMYKVKLAVYKNDDSRTDSDTGGEDMYTSEKTIFNTEGDTHAGVLDVDVTVRNGDTVTCHLFWMRSPSKGLAVPLKLQGNLTANL